MTREHDLDDIVALLARTPSALEALLRDLPETLTHRNEGENTWSAFEIVAHLIQAENNKLDNADKVAPGIRRDTGFEPFVRQPDEGKISGKSLAQILGEFAWLRSENLDALRALNLKPSDLERRGLHPTLGTVKLGELLATWAAHDLTHLHQLTRVMAWQYRETVGPFQQIPGRNAVRRT